ncbi:MAG: DUF4402 domain-containing protein [Pseudomonadota bacterium]|nr:DUF4402 domain-containing protein [Pseudomonadota bacterium]
MKNKFLGATALAAAVLFAAPALAADSEPMTSTALLLKPLTLTHLSDLSFGSIIPSGSGDLVTIDADDGSRSSDTAELITTDAGFRARFGSSGVNTENVFLELSPEADLVNADGDLLELTRLDLDSAGALRVLTPESQVFFVGIGGQVFVRSDQEEGTYTGTFTLTASYF